MYSLIRKALPWAFACAFVLGVALFATEYLFSISVFMLLAGTVADVLYGKEMVRRGLFHAVLVILYAVVIATTPRCGAHDKPVDETGLSYTD